MVFCYGSCLHPLWLPYPKYHRLGELKQQMFISHSPGGCKVQDHSAAKFDYWWEPSSWFADEYLVASSYTQTERKRMQTLTQLRRPHSHDLITSQRLHLPMELRISTSEFGEWGRSHTVHHIKFTWNLDVHFSVGSWILLFLMSSPCHSHIFIICLVPKGLELCTLIF